MNVILQITAILAVFFITFVSFQAFGPRNKFLLFTREEKDKWDRAISGKLSQWLTITNVVGVLTSLATAYLFFIGNAKLFGWFVFICCVTIWLSGYVTNFFTNKLLKNSYLKELFFKKEQAGGVIASLFWRPRDKSAILTSTIVKWVSIVNILSIIWLEFALFTDIAGKIFHINDLVFKIAILFLVTFLVVFFTVKYGLRGFVFADSFQSPLIAISAIALIIGSIILMFVVKPDPLVSLKEIFRPILSLQNCILFTFHVIAGNLFINTVTESHWLRVWIFGNKETQLQIKSQFSTAFVWLLLIFVGFGAFYLSGNAIGPDAIVGLLNSLTTLSPVFLVFFWIGGTSALFSTADGQIYSFLLAYQFDTKSGRLKEKLLKNINPLIYSILFAIIFSILYFVRVYFDLPFEKIIFIIMPASLNLLPAFVRASKNFPPQPILIVISVLAYLTLSIIGLLMPTTELSWTLSAALAPIIISIYAGLKK